MVYLCGCSRAGREGETCLFYQLPACFIQADNRIGSIIGAFVYLKYIFHIRYEFRSGFWDAPFFMKPGLKFVFLM